MLFEKVMKVRRRRTENFDFQVRTYLLDLVMYSRSVTQKMIILSCRLLKKSLYRKLKPFQFYLLLFWLQTLVASIENHERDSFQAFAQLHLKSLCCLILPSVRYLTTSSQGFVTISVQVANLRICPRDHSDYIHVTSSRLCPRDEYSGRGPKATEQRLNSKPVPDRPRKRKGDFIYDNKASLRDGNRQALTRPDRGVGTAAARNRTRRLRQRSATPPPGPRLGRSSPTAGGGGGGGGGLALQRGGGGGGGEGDGGSRAHRQARRERDEAQGRTPSNSGTPARPYIRSAQSAEQGRASPAHYLVPCVIVCVCVFARARACVRVRACAWARRAPRPRAAGFEVCFRACACVYRAGALTGGKIWSTSCRRLS